MNGFNNKNNIYTFDSISNNINNNLSLSQTIVSQKNNSLNNQINTIYQNSHAEVF